MALLILSSYSHTVPKELLLEAKQDGFSDRQVGQILGSSEREARDLRLSHGIKPWVKQVSMTGLVLGALIVGPIVREKCHGRNNTYTFRKEYENMPGGG